MKQQGPRLFETNKSRRRWWLHWLADGLQRFSEEKLLLGPCDDADSNRTAFASHAANNPLIRHQLIEKTSNYTSRGRADRNHRWLCLSNRPSCNASASNGPSSVAGSSQRTMATPAAAGGLPTLTALDEELDRMIAALDAEAFEK